MPAPGVTWWGTMDDVFYTLLAWGCGLSLLALAGCVFGVLGWIRASRAQAEIAALRRLLREQPPAAPVAAAPAPIMEPGPRPAQIWGAPLPAAPEPATPPAAAPAVAARRFDLEQALTQRWGVWLGAAALLLAGVFLVRTAVEQGWLGPAPRCALAAAFGAALIGAAEWARRLGGAGRPWGDTATPGLAAGGVGVLFAAAYGAGPLYSLVSGPAALLLLGAAGVTGLLLSLRFGQLVGAIGLAASFITPALVSSSDPSLPGLFVYLLFVSAASWAVVRWTAWIWLGWAAAAAGAAWIGSVVVTVAGGTAPDLWAAGLFVPASVALSLALLPGAALDNPVGRRFAWAPMAVLGLAGLALLSASRDEWVRAGLLLLSVVAVAKAWREPRLAVLPLLSAAFGVATIWVWGTEGLQHAELGFDALLPRVWTLDDMLWPFIGIPALIAIGHAAAGLLGERVQPRPVPWAGLVAAVPVAVLAVAYATAGHTVSHGPWGLAAVVLAAALVGTAAAAAPAQDRAGVHAAGAVAALALGFAILLADEWLTVALALLLPGLAWIEGRTGLRPLRRVALVVASVVLVRLVLNPWVAGYAIGSVPVFNGLLVAYGIPAVAFGVAAWWFGRRADDTLLTVLEAGTVAFGALLVLLEVHHAATGGELEAIPSSFAEWAWQVSACWVLAAGLRWLAKRSGRTVQRTGWQVLGVLGWVGGVLLLLLNPYWVGGLGDDPVWSALIPAYLLPALLAATTAQPLAQPASGGARAIGLRLRWPIGGYAYLAALLFMSLAVRQAFHPGQTEPWMAPTLDAELWSVSGAWLLLAVVLLGAGMALRRRVVRLAGLATMVLVVAKVFGIDMAGLDGLWRVLSFAGLGLSLMGLAAFYRRFAGAEQANG